MRPRIFISLAFLMVVCDAETRAQASPSSRLGQLGNAGESSGTAHSLAANPAMMNASWSVLSNSGVDGEHLGFSVSAAGDVNGDGYDDVIVGGPYFDTNNPPNGGSNDEGHACVYHGSTSGLGANEAWTFGLPSSAAHSGALFGASVSSAGDVNGDGYDDVIIGARRDDNGELDEGRAFAFHGSPTGLETAEAWVVESNDPGAELGACVSGAGDVNGDGYDDAIVGAPFYGSGGEGRAYVYLGSSAGLGAVEAWAAGGSPNNGYFGAGVSSAGDVNGDGYDDVIVGEPGYSGFSGRVHVYLGSPSGLATTAAWTAESNDPGAFFGLSVASAGDVNGDGYDDVIIGAPYYGNGEMHEGRACVYLGSPTGLGPIEVWTAEANQDSAYFGSVSGAGDIDGDGYDDVVVGASGYSNGEIREGRAYVYRGSATGVDATEAWVAEGNQAEASFGFAVANAGDVNGDTYADVIVGAYYYNLFTLLGLGAAFVYHGTATPAPYCTAGTSASGCQAHISSSGVASATALSGFCLNTSSVEGAKDGLYYFGTNGRQGNPWGNGTSFQCVIPPVKRTGLLTGTGTPGFCDGAFSQDLNALWCPTCPRAASNPGAGAAVQAQLWFRDPFNTSNQTTSLSDAIEFVVTP